MPIDPTPISGAAGLAKSHTVTQDGETTVMRSGQDMQDVAGFIARQETGCKGREGVIRSVFQVNVKSVSKSGNRTRNDCGEFNTRDGELNG